MVRLAVPAVEQAWADITAAPAASPTPCYEAHVLGDLFDNQKPRYGFVWYICLCPARRRKTVLRKMNNCYLTLATAYNGLRTKEVAEGNLDKVKRSLLSIVSWSCFHKMKRVVELINHP